MSFIVFIKLFWSNHILHISITIIRSQKFFGIIILKKTRLRKIRSNFRKGKIQAWKICSYTLIDFFWWRRYFYIVTLWYHVFMSFRTAGTNHLSLLHKHERGVKGVWLLIYFVSIFRCKYAQVIHCYWYQVIEKEV